MIGRMCLAGVLLAATSVSALAQTGGQFPASNRLKVQPETARTFEVVYRNGYGEPDYWCAAAQYVTVALGQPRSTIIYRTSEPPRRSGAGIRYSLDAAGAASSTGLSSFGASGTPGGISAGTALGSCARRSPSKS
jgi:hypothetical protein